MHGGQAPTLELFLFTRDVDLAIRAVDAGIDGLVVDWEREGKHVRQRSADTEINEDTVDDLRRLRAATGARARILCRINAVGATTADEVDAAVEAGADEVLLPMVRGVEDVAHALELVAGRIELGIMVETVDAVASARQLARQPISRVFLGLNDLAIERGSPSIFTSLVDGTIDDVRSAFEVPFGVAAVTVVDGGQPLPCRLLIGELARLRCGFTILRRSFRRDMAGRRFDVELPRIRAALEDATARCRDDVERDRAELVAAVHSLESATSRSQLASLAARA